jgi:hypothetical protein
MTERKWMVRRWGGLNRYPHRVVFVGSEHEARAKFDKLHRDMRQGTVELVDDEGKTVKRDWAPRLRTRW